MTQPAPKSQCCFVPVCIVGSSHFDWLELARLTALLACCMLMLQCRLKRAPCSPAFEGLSGVFSANFAPPIKSLHLYRLPSLLSQAIKILQTTVLLDTVIGHWSFSYLAPPITLLVLSLFSPGTRSNKRPICRCSRRCIGSARAYFATHGSLQKIIPFKFRRKPSYAHQHLSIDSRRESSAWSWVEAYYGPRRLLRAEAHKVPPNDPLISWAVAEFPRLQ